MASLTPAALTPASPTTAAPARAALLIAMLLAALAAPRAAPAEAPAPDKEYQVKAVFLYNFAQFVDWPDSAFEGPESPLVLGILGSDPFHDYLDEVVAGEKVRGRPIEVARYPSPERIGECHVLFVSAAESARVPGLLDRLEASNVLTVGESDLFAREGGMVCFVKRQGKIRLRINLDAVQAARLTVSSKLLRLAEIVGPGGG